MYFSEVEKQMRAITEAKLFLHGEYDAHVD